VDLDHLTSNDGFGLISSQDADIAAIIASGRKLIIVAGQSNAAFPAWADASAHTAPGIIEPQRSGVGNSFANVNQRAKASWTTADPPVWHIDSTAALAGVSSSAGNPAGKTSNMLGFQQAMLRHLDYYRSNAWDVVTVAITATSLAVHWLPTGTFPTVGGQPNLFTQMLTVADAAAVSFSSTPAVFVWCQGESDGADATQAAAYETNLTALFAAVRAHWPGIAIVFNKLSSQNTNATQSATIRTAQVNVAAATSNCTLVTIDDAGIMMADHAHFVSDACNALGDRFGNAIVGLLGLTSPVSWTIDTTMLVGCPVNNTEWAAVFAAANAQFGVGITSAGADSIFLCQEGSGGLTDSLGNHAMTVAGGGTISYQQNNVNWTRKEIVLPSGNTGHFENTDSTLPDPATTSWARIAYPYITQGASAANLWSLGTSGFATIQRRAGAPTFNPLELFEGGTATDSTTQVTPGTRPTVHVRNKTSSLVDVFVDIDHIQASTGTVTGKRTTMGVASTGLGNNLQLGIFYWADFKGADAEFTVAQMRAILKVLNWGNTNLGMPAITW
jgi:hypothetical protein